MNWKDAQHLFGRPANSFRDNVYEAALWFGASVLQSERLKRRKIFLDSVIALAAYITCADGDMSEREIAVLHKYLSYDYAFRPAPQQRNRVRKKFYQALESDKPFEDYAAEVYQAFESHPVLLRNILSVLFEIAAADGVMHATEEKLLRTLTVVFGFGEKSYEFLERQFQHANKRTGRRDSQQQEGGGKTLSAYYAVFELDPGVPFEEVKSKYRAMVKEWHPDRLHGLGLPNEFSEFASKRFREIQEAYEAIEVAV